MCAVRLTFDKLLYNGAQSILLFALDVKQYMKGCKYQTYLYSEKGKKINSHIRKTLIMDSIGQRMIVQPYILLVAL